MTETYLVAVETGRRLQLVVGTLLCVTELHTSALWVEYLIREGFKGITLDAIVGILG